MKKVYLVVFLFISFVTVGFAQESAIKTASPLPPFRIMLTNGTYITNKELPRNKPTVLIYFAPDCEHCTVLMDALFTKIHQLDNTSIVLVTFKSSQELVGFEKKYQTASYPNIIVGTEGLAYTLRNYYKLDKTPFTAVYNKKGLLAFYYKNVTPVDALLARVKKI